MLTDRPKKGHPKKDQERASVQVMKIEREKYQLLEQIKTYQEKISQQETQSRRMEKRYEQMVKHISAFEEKLKESRSERKTLQKQIIYIVQFVDRIVHKLCRFNKSFVDCFVKALENLLFKKSFDFESSLKFMDRNAIRESFFDYLKTLKLTKIDFNKVKRSMVRAQNKVPGYDTSEGIKALESLYDKLSEQIGNSKFDISKKDISEILGQFQSHKMLLRRNSDLLSRRSAMEESSIEFGFNKHPQAPSATMGCPSYGSSFVVPAESMNQSMSSFMDVSNFKSSILSLNTSTMSLLENREETAELMSIYENLEEKKDDFDLKLKLASKRTSKLKREVERANSTLEVKRGELRAVQAQGEKLEGDFERVLAELEGKIWKKRKLIIFILQLFYIFGSLFGL